MNPHQTGNKTTEIAVNPSEDKLMKFRNAFVTVGLLFGFVIMLPSARAGVYDRATKLTFNQPVQIPGRVLPAGTYWFLLANTPSS
jgi:hypothetical protein